MIYKLNNQQININDQITINDVTYPRGTLLMRRDEWAELGITEEAEPVPTPPTQAELDAQHNADILSQIASIENQSNMSRQVREYMLTVLTGIPLSKVKVIDDEIVVLRGQLI